MTEQSNPLKTNGNEGQSITDGRYLYCLVDTTAASNTSFTTTGIDDEPVSVIEAGGVGAVVHDCERKYNSEHRDRLVQWVLTHQQVVDAAGERFGTPLPTRFGTVLEGGDEQVKAWLNDQQTEIATRLSSFAGQWEYRVQLLWDAEPFKRAIVGDDPELEELERRRKRSGAGKRFLLEKQSAQRTATLKKQRRTELRHALNETIKPHVNELREQNARSLPENPPRETDGDCIARVAVLTEQAQESALGRALDDFVEVPGVEIRFTGPWPPYTFAPELG